LLKQLNRVSRREDHSARLGDRILDFNDKASKKSERPLILDWQPVKAGIGTR
jgi:hypothetical protein